MASEDPMRPVDSLSTKLTYDDLLDFPEDGRRHELIDGEHYVTPSPNTRHQRICRRLSQSLGAHLQVAAAGEVFFAPFDVVFTESDVVEPDLLVVLDDQADIVTEKHVRGAPAIVVEILSPRTRRTDEVIKRRLYARTGVREYWVVDPELDTLKIYRRAADGSFPRTAELSREEGDTLTTPLLPGFALGLDGLFV